MKFIKYLVFFLLAFILGNLISPLLGFGCLPILIYPSVCSPLHPYDTWTIVAIFLLLEILASRYIDRNKMTHPTIFSFFRKLYLAISFFLLVIALWIIALILTNMLVHVLIPDFGCLMLPSLDSSTSCRSYSSFGFVCLIVFTLLGALFIGYKIFKKVLKKQ